MSLRKLGQQKVQKFDLVYIGVAPIIICTDPVYKKQMNGKVCQQKPQINHIYNPIFCLNLTYQSNSLWVKEESPMTPQSNCFILII